MYLGFPSIELETYVVRRCWNATVYAGLRKFHEGKGFDPDSQDIALHLGHPLYQLLHEREVPFAHVDMVSDVETETESISTATTDDEDGSTPEDMGCEVSDIENERESTTEDEGGDGSAPEDVDGKIPEMERKGEGSSSATNEDQDRDKLTAQEECTSLDSVTDVESVPQSWSWKVVMLVKFALILALAFGSLYEYGQAAFSQ
ncbi:hypothetical protein B0H11DRAFT_2275054 [Mycena galericulata]|nr:hypothetical protein B0H11DRAFT_2275054 [Mycena galericulata]